MLKRIIFAALSFIGWILSPFTWWNDTFVNLPLAYILASVINKLVPHKFLATFLISYWFTNILGIILMYVGAEHLATKELFKAKRRTLLATLLLYSIISALLIKFNIIKPF